MLVVDDDPDVRDLLTIVLDEVGRVSTCRDAYEALVRLRNEHVDVLVTDLILPGANAVEMLERMADSCALPPVVVLTGFPQAALIDRLRNLGVEDILEKPNGLAALAETVSRLAGASDAEPLLA